MPLAAFSWASTSRDQLTLLADQAADRLRDLVPIRYGLHACSAPSPSPEGRPGHGCRSRPRPAVGPDRGDVRVRARVELPPVPLAGTPALFDAHDFDKRLSGPSSTTSSGSSPAWWAPRMARAPTASNDVGLPSPLGRATGRRWRSSPDLATSTSGTRTSTPTASGSGFPRGSTTSRAGASPAPERARTRDTLQALGSSPRWSTTACASAPNHRWWFPVVADADPDAFAEPLSRIDGLHFVVTDFATSASGTARHSSTSHGPHDGADGGRPGDHRAGAPGLRRRGQTGAAGARSRRLPALLTRRVTRPRAGPSRGRTPRRSGRRPRGPAPGARAGSAGH